MTTQTQNWLSFAHNIESMLSLDTEKIKLLSIEFVPAVANHIRDYVLPQYGEQIALGQDMVSQASDPVAYCTDAIKRYRMRFGRNQRPYNDGRDCLKRAHYTQLRADARGQISSDDVKELQDAFYSWLTL